MVILPLDTCITSSVAKIANGYGIEEFAYLTAYVQPHVTGNTLVLSGTLLTWCVANAENQLEGSLGRPDNVTEGNIVRIFDKVVSAVGTTFAAKDLGFFQLLEDLLKIPGADLLAPGDVLDLGRKTYRVVGNVEKSSDTVAALG
jgi:hypothetical protein